MNIISMFLKDVKWDNEKLSSFLGVPLSTVDEWVDGTSFPSNDAILQMNFLHNTVLTLRNAEPEEISEALTRYRDENDVTTMDMAHRLGVNPSTVNKYLRGQIRPQHERLTNVAELLLYQFDFVDPQTAIRILMQSFASLRMALGLKQSVVANWFGVTSPLISQWENGLVPGKNKLPKIKKITTAMATFNNRLITILNEDE